HQADAAGAGVAVEHDPVLAHVGDDVALDGAVDAGVAVVDAVAVVVGDGVAQGRAVVLEGGEDAAVVDAGDGVAADDVAHGVGGGRAVGADADVGREGRAVDGEAVDDDVAGVVQVDADVGDAGRARDDPGPGAGGEGDGGRGGAVGGGPRCGGVAAGTTNQKRDLLLRAHGCCLHSPCFFRPSPFAADAAVAGRGKSARRVRTPPAGEQRFRDGAGPGARFMASR